MGKFMPCANPFPLPLPNLGLNAMAESSPIPTSGLHSRTKPSLLSSSLPFLASSSSFKPQSAQIFTTMPLHLPSSTLHLRSLSFSFSSNVSNLPKLAFTKMPSHSRIPKFLHVKPGKGAAFVRTKMRNYITGNTVEKTFRAGSAIDEADVFKETKQYTYKDGSQYVFMDLTTYEESRLNEDDVGDKTKYLKEGMDCNLLFWKGQVIDFELPITVKLTVVDVDPGVRGDTVSGGSKPATLDTGAVVSVPLFINIGDEILVDTRTGQYMSRK
ncbi:hypothetical protein ACLOJK_031465 [Asimina triloba]